MENYLERCVGVDSSTTYTHFELILINDGSTDSSGQICDHDISVWEYQGLSYRKMLVFQMLEVWNSASEGSWITFIDSDDFVTQDYYYFKVQLKGRM